MWVWGRCALEVDYVLIWVRLMGGVLDLVWSFGCRACLGFSLYSFRGLENCFAGFDGGWKVDIYHGGGFAFLWLWVGRWFDLVFCEFFRWFVVMCACVCLGVTTGYGLLL